MTNQPKTAKEWANFYWSRVAVSETMTIEECFQQIINQARSTALEEAAKVCDFRAEELRKLKGKELVVTNILICAARIRALIAEGSK